MMVTGGASQMRGSEFFRDKRLFPIFILMGLIRDSACSRTVNGQKKGGLSKYSMGSEANDGIIEKLRKFTGVCLQ